MTATQSQTVIYQVSAADLRLIMSEIYAQARRDAATEMQTVQKAVTRKEAMALLGVASSTLWNWAKQGYLVPFYIGSKAYYHKCDIDRVRGINLPK